MSHRPRHRILLEALGASAVLGLFSLRAVGADTSRLAPPTFVRPWPIPAAALADEPTSGVILRGTGGTHSRRIRDPPPGHQADAVIVCPNSSTWASAITPETRVAWQQARQAALAVGLVDSAYAPQISIEAIAGFQRTPLPIPRP